MTAPFLVAAGRRERIDNNQYAAPTKNESGFLSLNSRQPSRL
jgi:hypothetical protein